MSSDVLIGRTIGNYEILDRLGKGGMAVVYRARQITMQRDVAIKVMSADLVSDPQFVARFEREAQVIANLQHPRILPVHDFGHDGEVFFLVMRVIEGSTLFARLTDGALPLVMAGRFVNQIAEALDYAHSQGVVHRDLKPNNILIDTLDNVYLMDFGLAKMLASSTHLTATGAVLGTPAYMSPEQWRGEVVDARSDVYALGVILYEMVTGRTPFESDTPFTLMYKHINDAPPPPHSLVPTLPEQVEAVILKTLAKDKSARYPSAGDLARAFTDALQACNVQGCEILTPPLTPVVLHGEARPISDPELLTAILPSEGAPSAEDEDIPAPEDIRVPERGTGPDDALGDPSDALGDPSDALGGIAPPDAIAPPPPSVPGIPVAGQPASGKPANGLPGGIHLVAARIESDDLKSILPPRKPKIKSVTDGPDTPGTPIRELVDRLHESSLWQGAMEVVERGLETALEHAAENAPVEKDATWGQLAPEALAHQQVRAVLAEDERLVGVLDVRGTPEWRLWQKLIIGGLVANILGGIVSVGLLSTLGVLAWVFVFVQAVRTWRGRIGRYYLGFTSQRLILLPRDAEGDPVLADAQAAAWPVIDRVRLTGRYLMFDVPSRRGRGFHFAGLVLPQGDGGLGAQYEWLPGSPIVGLLAEQGYNVADELV